jgi:hypothetical protein
MKTEPIEAPQGWQDLRPHPLSKLVEFGAGIEIDALVDHINKHGYADDEAIVLHDGMILDGRHRHEAAKRAGVTPPFRQFCGRNAMAYAAKKLFRQHLSESQRAMMAETLINVIVPDDSPKAQNCASTD